MPSRVLIVEDEVLVAGHLEMLLENMGHIPVGIAASFDEARNLGTRAPEIALVDCNLRDGLSGPSIGDWLTQQGVTVVFMTATPDVVKSAERSAIGVVCKPCGDDCLQYIMDYACAVRAGRADVPAPANLIPLRHQGCIS